MKPPGIRQQGLTLIELVIFIVLVSVAFSALHLAINQFTRHSSDPLLQKQALAIAESLLDEVELMPFTYCDPDDSVAATATSTASCTGGAGASEDGLGVGTAPCTIGPESGESRYSTSTPFDNVSDYCGFSMSGIKPIYDASTPIPGLENYSASVSVTQAGLGAIAASDALRITVTVTDPTGATLSLDGYRTRYSPTTAQ